MAISNGQIVSFMFGSDDIGPDVISFNMTNTTAQLEMSGLAETGHARVAGRHDGQITGTSRFSDAATNAHDVLSPATDTQVSGSVVITFVNGAVFTMHCVVQNYDVADANDLGLTASWTLLNDDGTAGAWT